MSSALSASRRQKHPRSEHSVPVSVIAVNSSPPVQSSVHSREMFYPRHRHASGSAAGGWRQRPVSVDVWTPTADEGASMRRSASATLSNDAGDCRVLHSSTLQSPLSSSTHHLGSSVTFCNAVPTAAAGAGGRVNASVDLNLVDELGAIRRSSSLNHATDSALRPSGTPTTSSTYRTKQQQQQQQVRERLPHTRGKLGLALPVITCDGVTSVPTSPLRHIRSDVTGFGSTLQLHPGTMSLGGGSRAGGSSRTILVTPQGSFLSVNQSPIEFRESTVSISYSNGAGARPSFPMLTLLVLTGIISRPNADTLCVRPSGAP